MSNIVIRNARHSGTSGFIPVFNADDVAHLLSFLCCVFFCFVCVRFLLCDQCCLCLDCPFLITPLFVFIFCFVTNVVCVWIVHSWLHLCLCSFSALWPMLPVSRLSILDYTFVCVRFLSCDQCCLCLDCPFLITPLFVFVFCFVTNVWGKTSWHKGLPVVKTIYTYGFHELFRF
jgi:hypothetical protein